jgi:hypothetical protein
MAESMPELPSLVAGCRDHRPGTGPGDDKGLALQLRAAQQLNRCIERIDVAMSDDTPLGHTPKLARSADKPPTADLLDL